ncbi:MAG: penicillin-insensitive murein endopeptidase [Polyangiales bacterium]
MPSLRVGLLAAALAAGHLGCAHLLPGAASSGGSRGSPSSGWLSQGARLPERGYGFSVYRTESETGHLWGTARVVAMVRRAARAMMRDGSTVPLRVGDLSAPRGGRVERHHSHRNGRDVDLLFFAKDAATDLPVLTPGFVRYTAAGLSVGRATPMRFDTARNWKLVEVLLRDPDVAVIRIFCAAWIRRMLLDHARSVGAPAPLVERAERVLAQPGDSAPHDDHFHVRVACTPAERTLGCLDGGPLWSWLEKDWEKDDALPSDDESILAAMEPIPPGVVFGPPTPPAIAEAPLAPFCAAPVEQSAAQLIDGAVCLPPPVDQGAQPSEPQLENPAATQSNLNG